MKKRLVSLLLAFSMMLTFLPVGAMAADTITQGNLKYTINPDGKSVTVSGRKGSPTELNIKSSISDDNDISYTVTKIADMVFASCSSLTQVTIPSTVKEIGYQAFWGCSNLVKVTIPEGVTTIGQTAFTKCTQLTSITIPSTITNMEWAFSGDPALSQVTLTNGIPRISSYAFSGCTSLTQVKIPASVDEVCPSAFNGCTGLTSVTLEKGIRIININAFNNCSKLTDVKYNGYKADWEKVRVNTTGNDTLTNKIQYLCDISFDLNGGTVNGSSTVEKQTVYSKDPLATAKCYQSGQPFVVPSDPVREGYDFDGWYTQAEGGTEYTFPEAVSSNITLYAHWNAHSHTVTLENDENKETNLYDYGSSVSVPTPTKKTGYNFNHWEVTVPDGETAPSLNGPDENGNYSFSMPDYDITLTAKWTQKDVIDPDVDLKFDAVTGEVTSNNANINADDIINKKFYDEKGNEVPSEKLNDRGLPTEPGDYIIKVDVKETENTAPANQVTGHQIKWSYNVPQKEEKVTYTLSILGGIAKVNGKDPTINDHGDITIEKDATVEVTFDKSILSDAQTFDQWTIKPTSVLNAVDPKAETITFTMPGENVFIEAMTKDASIEEEPNILGTTLIIGTAAAGTAVLAYQTYQLGAEFYLICALPTGTAIPTNRGELAELVWNNAGKPEPAVLNANATETDKAITWAVENDLLKAAKNNGETYEATDPVSHTEVIKAWNQVQAFKK